MLFEKLALLTGIELTVFDMLHIVQNQKHEVSELKWFSCVG